jgi:hypothetical protein
MVRFHLLSCAFELIQLIILYFFKQALLWRPSSIRQTFKEFVDIPYETGTITEYLESKLNEGQQLVWLSGIAGVGV